MRSLWFLLLLCFSSLLSAQEIGGLFVGVNHYLPAGETNHFNVQENGIGFGFLVPIHVPGVTLYFKAKGAHHQADWQNEYKSMFYYRPPVNYFLSASNEFLMGRTLKLGQRHSLVPQIGFGVTGEAAYSDWDVGYTHGNVFMDVSLMFIQQLENFDLGLLVNYEHDLIEDAAPLVSEARLNLVLVILK